MRKANEFFQMANIDRSSILLKSASQSRINQFFQLIDYGHDNMPKV